MALIKCKDCEKEFSTDAKACPNCGAKPPVNQKAQIGCAVIILFLVLFFAMMSTGADEAKKTSQQTEVQSQKEPPTPSLPLKGTMVIIALDGIWCFDKGDSDHLANLIASGDKEAYGKAILRGVLEKRCGPVKKDTDAIISDRAVFSGMAKVRPKGDDREYWMPFSLLNSYAARYIPK